MGSRVEARLWQGFCVHPAAFGLRHPRIRQPLAGTWVACGSLQQGKHHSRISRRFWEASRAGNLRPATSSSRPPFFKPGRVPYIQRTSTSSKITASCSLWQRDGLHLAAPGMELPSHPAAIGLLESSLNCDGKQQIL